MVYRVWTASETFNNIDEMAWTKTLEARKNGKRKHSSSTSSSSDSDDSDLEPVDAPVQKRPAAAFVNVAEERRKAAEDTKRAKEAEKEAKRQKLADEKRAKEEAAAQAKAEKAREINSTQEHWNSSVAV